MTYIISRMLGTYITLDTEFIPQHIDPQSEPHFVGLWDALRRCRDSRIGAVLAPRELRRFCRAAGAIFRGTNEAAAQNCLRAAAFASVGGEFEVRHERPTAWLPVNPPLDQEILDLRTEWGWP